jgi:hypothetical protein
MTQRPVGLPKPWLEADEVQRLNEAFYATQPHDYFATRLTLLMVAAAKPEVINHALVDGLEYGTLKIGRDAAADEEPDEEGERQAVAFVAGDAMNLLQHVSETVLRYYLAHCPDPQGRLRACPWLTIADEVNFAAFKRAVERRFADDATELTAKRRDDVTIAFYLARNGGTDDPVELERLARSVDEIEGWLRHFARYFLDDARLYNAMKHGLAVRPGQSMVEVKTPADEERVARGERPLIHQDGPSIEYLGRTGPDEPFKRVTRWIRPDVAMAEARIANWMLEQIWTIGRTRYVDLPAGTAKPMRLRFYDQVGLDKVLDAHLNEKEFARLVISSLEFPVGYMWAYEPDLKCTICGRVPRADEERPRRTWRGLADGNTPIQPICTECIPTWRTATS